MNLITINVKSREIFKTRFAIFYAFLSLTCFFGGALKAETFDKAKDILIAQFDNKPDADDIHSQAALGCILAHPDGMGINVYGVSGAYGKQDGTYICSRTLFSMIFGDENTNWTDAHLDRPNSIKRICDKVRPILEAGGKVWVPEAGQSDITAAWIEALLVAGVPGNIIKNNVKVVQHSGWNENETTANKLIYVKDNANYVTIDDGNEDPGKGHDRGPNTPSYKSYDTTFMKEALGVDNLNLVTKKIWNEADSIIKASGFSASYSTIHLGGVDFSDNVEIWYILGLGENANSIKKFWDRYVVKHPIGYNPGPEVEFLSIISGSCFEPQGNITADVKATDNGSITKVELRSNGTLVGTDYTEPYTFNLTNYAEGLYLFEAMAYDNENKTAKSTVNVSVEPPTNLSNQNIYLEKNGIVVAETENLVFNDKWQFLNDVPGFTGKGYLKYVGPIMGEKNPNAHNIDVKCEVQGLPQDRLIVWVKITTTGLYSISLHTYHVLNDGDNDAWVGRMDNICEATRTGTWGTDKGKWVLNGFCGSVGDNDSHTPTNEAPCHPMKLEAGKVYGIYVAGRSYEYCVDRIMLYMESAKDEATNLSTPPSETILGAKCFSKSKK